MKNKEKQNFDKSIGTYQKFKKPHYIYVLVEVLITSSKKLLLKLIFFSASMLSRNKALKTSVTLHVDCEWTYLEGKFL